MLKALIATALGCALFAADSLETTRIWYPFGGKQVGRWTFGALVGWDDPAPIFAFDKQAQQIANTVIRTPAEASGIRVYRAVRAPDGGYAAAGMAYLPTGAAACVWRISADGTQQNVILTAPYIATDLAVTPDGMVWTAGVQKQTARMSYEDYADAWDIVHRFAPNGRPAGSWLSTGSVKPKEGRWHAGATGVMLASADKVVWYAPGSTEFVEFSLGGRITAENPTVPLLPDQDFAGAALCGNGRLYVGRGAGSRFELLGWDPGTRSWRVVAAPRAWGWLYGCEADRLVTSSLAPAGAMQLDFWTPRLW